MTRLTSDPRPALPAVASSLWSALRLFICCSRGPWSRSREVRVSVWRREAACLFTVCQKRLETENFSVTCPEVTFLGEWKNKFSSRCNLWKWVEVRKSHEWVKYFPGLWTIHSLTLRWPPLLWAFLVVAENSNVEILSCRMVRRWVKITLKAKACVYKICCIGDFGFGPEVGKIGKKCQMLVFRMLPSPLVVCIKSHHRIFFFLYRFSNFSRYLFNTSLPDHVSGDKEQDKFPFWKLFMGAELFLWQK